MAVEVVVRAAGSREASCHPGTERRRSYLREAPLVSPSVCEVSVRSEQGREGHAGSVERARADRDMMVSGAGVKFRRGKAANGQFSKP